MQPERYFTSICSISPLLRSICIMCVVGLIAAATAAANDGAGTAGAIGAIAPDSGPSLEQFLRIRAPGSVTLAGDGTLYARDWPDGVNQLYRRPAGADLGAEMDRLTDFEDGLGRYALSPDERHIILSAAIGGSEHDDLFHLDTKTDEITPLLTDRTVIYRFHLWQRDSSGFLYSANDVSSFDFYLYRYDLESRQSTLISAREGSWSASDITDDGSRALVMRYISAAHANVYELDLESGELTSLNIADERYNAVLGYLTGESRAAVVSDANEEGFRRLHIVNLDTGEHERPVRDLDDREFEGWSANHERSLVALRYNIDGYAAKRVYRLPAFEPIELPELDRGMVADLDIVGETLIWRISNARSPGEAFALDLGRDRAEVEQLTRAETQGIDLAQFTLPELISYESFDRMEIPAFLYLPPGYDRDQDGAIPFIAHYHGGPESQFRPWFNAQVQALLAQGYGVIQPNVRGSTGYGRTFHQLDNYKKRWDSVRDGVEAVRWLIDRGYAEAGRVAAYGGSYGGFMAVATVIEGQELYGASVKVVGIVNFITFLEQTGDYRRALREAEYGPLSDREFLESISPINRIDEINVPMMIAHGLNDPRVPVGEAMQLAVGLQQRDFDPELVFFPDEGHGFAKLENRLLFFRRMVRFLDRTIGGPEEANR